MYRHHPQFHVLLEGMDTDPDPVPQNGYGGQVVGSNGQPERASSLLAGTFTTAALNALSISEDALPPPEQLLAMMEASGGWLWFLFEVLIGGVGTLASREQHCFVGVLHLLTQPITVTV